MVNTDYSKNVINKIEYTTLRQVFFWHFQEIQRLVKTILALTFCISPSQDIVSWLQFLLNFLHLALLALYKKGTTLNRRVVKNKMTGFYEQPATKNDKNKIWFYSAFKSSYKLSKPFHVQYLGWTRRCFMAL